jgi:fatty-acyl-CoA synthase
MHAPFAPAFPIRNLDGVRRLEQVPLEQAVPVRSTYEIFVNSAHAFGDRTALTFLRTADPADEPTRVSYSQLLDGIRRTANLLHRLGVGPQDAVGVLLPGCIEYHFALWGGAAAGIVQPLNPLLSEAKLASLLNAGRARVLIAWGAEDDAGFWSKAMTLRDQVPSLETVLRVAPLGESAADGPVLPPGVLHFQAALAHERGDVLASRRVIAPSDIAAYFHTGGTTGAPKLARHSHGAQVFTAWACVQLQGLRTDDITINGYPLFHVAGVLPGSLTSFAAGAQVIIPTTALFRNREVIANYWRLVERHRSTVLSAVPTVLAALANVPVAGADIASLRYCRTGAAILPPELAARFENQFGLHVHESLGMTEMAGISTVTPPGVTAPAGCVGFRLPYSQLRIVALDEHGNATQQDQPAGVPGMVLFRSPNLFSGFVEAADNAKAFTPDGWLASGDLGWLDPAGRLHLSGRSKDLIIRSGHNIDPKIIEDALGAHPAVQMCAAVGAPDAYAGELPVAFAALVPGAQASEQELLDFTAARVDEAPARPRSITIVAALPLTNVGKIYKPELRMVAAVRVAQALADQVAASAGSTAPRIRAESEKSLVIELDGSQHEGLGRRLLEALGRLPLQVRLGAKARS